MTLATLAKAYRKLLTDAIVRELQLPAPASGNKILYDGGVSAQDRNVTRSAK